jgi:hypothetical protein
MAANAAAVTQEVGAPPRLAFALSLESRSVGPSPAERACGRTGRQGVSTGRGQGPSRTASL